MGMLDPRRYRRARERRASKRSFDDDLAGEPGLTRVYTDVRQNPYDSVVARKPEPGANLTLTIDPNLQYEAEKELERGDASERREDRIDRGDESVQRRNAGDGELSDLRSERARRTNEAPRRAQQSGDHDAVRAGQRVQSGHAFGGAGNHESAGRTRSSTAATGASICSAA